MAPEELENDLRVILSKLKGRAYDVRELVFAPPANEGAVRAMERALGKPLPSTFRGVLTAISAQVEFCWFAPSGLKFPPPFNSNFCGELHWSLGRLLQLEKAREQWAAHCFADSANDYDRVWYDKLAVQEVANGDFIAIDLRPSDIGKVVYLSHDGGDGHGLVLAPSFLDLIARWVPLACTGPEDWQWRHFLSEDGTGLDPECDNARAWRTLLGVAS